jgi:hypothetical protein
MLTIIEDVLEKISESSYYRQIFLNNNKLIDQYITKFYENENKKVFLMQFTANIFTYLKPFIYLMPLS